ncbi:MAG: DUF3592 domain-containing protein [Planctomycetota bacterium]|jgi:hypothetical protein
MHQRPGATLADARAVVEQLETELRGSEKFEARAGRQGDSSVASQRPGGPWFIRLLLLSLFMLFGTILLVVGVKNGASSWAFASRAGRTQGTVVRLDNSISAVKRHSNTKCRAVVSYQVGGESHEAFGPVQVQPGVHGWPKAYPVGDTVSVLYDPDRPEEALVVSFSEQWAEPLVFSGVGLTFLLVGIGLLWSRWRSRRSQLGEEQRR